MWGLLFVCFFSRSTAPHSSAVGGGNAPFKLVARRQLNQKKKKLAHDFIMNSTTISKRDRQVDSAPSTKMKQQAQKNMNGSEEKDLTNMTILEAVLNLEARVDKQLADLSMQSKQSNAMIANLAKAVQFNAEGLKERKQKIKDLEKPNEQNCKENSELKERVRGPERWCLRIKGLEEEKR